MTQAEDRVHRIGQADHVLVQYLVARGTSDDIMWPMLQAKLDTLNKAGLSKDDFREADSSNQILTASECQAKAGIEKYFVRDNSSATIISETTISDDDDDIIAKAMELEAAGGFVSESNENDNMFDDDSFLQILDDPEIEAAMRMSCSEEMGTNR